MREFLIVSFGAVLGANSRYFLSRFTARITTSLFPYATLFINVTGSLIVGFFMAWVAERALIDGRWRLLVVVGFCGSYTTFSGYAFDTISYFERGQWGLMATNILANNILCLAAVIGGMALAKAL